MNARQPGIENANCEQSLVERCEDLQKQGCSVENEMQENGGAGLQCIQFRERKVVLDLSDPGQN